MDMKSLITVKNSSEASKVANARTDIIDVKNPAEGSLGANLPWEISEILKVVPKNAETSIAVGDVPNLPGTVSLAVSGAAHFHPDYIKIGLKGPNSKKEAIDIMRKAVRSSKEIDKNINLVASGYADYKRSGTIDPMDIPEIAERSGAKVAMIDTAIKDGKTLLDHLDLNEIENFIQDAKSKGLTTAMAGSLKKEHIEELKEIGADIFGVRGAVCSESNREAVLKRELVEEIVKKVGI